MRIMFQSEVTVLRYYYLLFHVTDSSKLMCFTPCGANMQNLIQAETQSL